MRIYMKKPKWYEFWKKPKAVLIIEKRESIYVGNMFVGKDCILKCRTNSLVELGDLTTYSVKRGMRCKNIPKPTKKPVI